MLAVAICHCVDAVVVAVRVALNQRAALVPRVLIRGELPRRVRTCHRVDDDLIEVAQPVIARLPRILAFRYAGDVDAVVYADKDDVRMSVTTSEINQTIVKSIVDTFRTNRKVIADTIENDPALITSVIESMTEQVSYNKEINLSGGNMDFYIQYFYNLIAMICMLSCNTGLAIVVTNQANLSALGARKSVSPISNTSKLMAGFISTVCVNLIIIAIVMSYLIFILGIDFGSKIAPLFLAVFIGTIMGTSLGFFVGAFGNMKETTKTSLLTGVSLTLCALSGLMADSLPKMINRYCPIVNKINPAAILTDCFYALNIYDTYERFGFNLIKIAAYSAVFIVCGMTMLRRKKYASI